MQKFKIICLYLILIALTVFTVIEAQPRIKQILQNYKESDLKKEELITAPQSKRNSLKQEKEVQDELDLTREMYKSSSDIMGVDSGFNTLFEGVLEKADQAGIKTHSVEYEFITPGDKPSNIGVQKFSVCNLNMKVVANYVTFEKFLQEIYSYPYLIKINNMEIMPYQKDKRILLINLGLKLYVKN